MNEISLKTHYSVAELLKPRYEILQKMPTFSDKNVKQK